MTEGKAKTVAETLRGTYHQADGRWYVHVCGKKSVFHLSPDCIDIDEDGIEIHEDYHTDHSRKRETIKFME